MHALRTASMLARLVLAWFILALGVAVASPIVHPKTMELVCSAGGSMKMVVTNDDSQRAATGPHTLDCALCLATSAPLPQAGAPFEPPHPLAPALTPSFVAHIAALVGAPLPARGPPPSA